MLLFSCWGAIWNWHLHSRRSLSFAFRSFIFWPISFINMAQTKASWKSVFPFWLASLFDLTSCKFFSSILVLLALVVSTVVMVHLKVVICCTISRFCCNEFVLLGWIKFCLRSQLHLLYERFIVLHCSTICDLKHQLSSGKAQRSH